MKKSLYVLGAFLALIAGAIMIVEFYPYIFAKDVEGPIEGVERIQQSNVVVGTMSGMEKSTELSDKQFFSFAVAIRDQKTGEIYTASAEDRQWAVAAKGKCAQARIFPYPPWSFEKAGTYFGARLLKLYDCPTP